MEPLQSVTGPVVMPVYSLNQNQLETFSAIYLLNVMINEGLTFSVLLEGDQIWLKNLIGWMFQQDLLKLNGTRYVPDTKGRELLTKFMARYTECVRLYDLYSAVDLAKGEFGYSTFFMFGGDDAGKLAFKTYINQPQFEDLRIAVAEFKGLDPVELVFMSFMAEGRFETTPGWECRLLSKDIWTEILAICNTNLSWQELGYPGVLAEDLIKDVIEKGTALMFQLWKEEDLLNTQQAANDAFMATQQQPDETVETVVEEITTTTVVVDEGIYMPSYQRDYYSGYYDPCYRSSIWIEPLFVPVVTIGTPVCLLEI